MSAYAMGIWTVKDGHGDDFVRAWLELGERLREYLPDRKATLLHDRDQEKRFISFAPAESVEVLEKEREALAAIASQRESDGRPRMAGDLFEALDDVALFTLDVVGEIR